MFDAIAIVMHVRHLPDADRRAMWERVNALRSTSPIVIAHRGASGYRPEHTLASYALAIEQGADFIEPDLVASKDGVLVARHENEIGATTDVAERPEFASRRTKKRIDGVDVTGFFTEDFTLRELKTLRVKERIPRLRPGNVQYDGTYEIATLDEIIALAQRASHDGRVIGLYPETKHPSYFAALGLPLEDELVRTLHAHGYRGRDAPVFIQSFEVTNLVRLRHLTDLPLIQLMELDGAPYDLAQRGDARSYAPLRQPSQLAQLADTVAGIGVHKGTILPRDAGDRLMPATRLIVDAQRAGLLVHAWTFRAENAFLPRELRGADQSSAAHGDLAAELTQFLALGLDGVFCDHPDVAVAVRDSLKR